MNLKRWSLAVVLALSSHASLVAQPPVKLEIQKINPKIFKAFGDATGKASASTVRVSVDGSNVALGTVITSDGEILTKASVLQGSDIVVKLKDGRALPAKLVGVHEPYDLALLNVEAKGLTGVEWRPSKAAKVGQWVASPGTDSAPLAFGIVSVVTRPFKPGDQPPKTASSKGGFLGVNLAEGEGGAKIVGLRKDGPAEKAGLKVNDLVVEAAGKRILDQETLVNTVQRHKPGETIALKVKRGEEEIDITATLAKMPRELLGNPQERMGSLLSERRGGFPTILQHDSVLLPSDCGGPLVDLDGKVLGINIARAGRVESYAVPSEDILQLLPDLRSGKLAPLEK